MKKVKPSILPLTELPLDCVFEISNYFEKPKDVFHILGTCKLYYKYFTSPGFCGCKNVKFTIRPNFFQYSLESTSSSQISFPYVSYVEFNDFCSKFLSETVMNYPTKDVVNTFLNRTPKLRRMKIEGSLISLPISHVLERTRCSLVVLDAQVISLEIDSKFPEMKFLRVLVVERLFISSADCGEKLLPNIRSIEVRGNLNIGNNTALSLSCVNKVDFKKLNELKLWTKNQEYFAKLAGVIDVNFITACRKIEVLEAYPLSLVNVEYFKHLKEVSLNLLDVLNLSSDESMKFPRLSVCRVVVHLGGFLSNKRNVRTKIIAMFFQSNFIRGLKKLLIDFHGFRWISNSQVSEIRDHMAQISRSIQTFCADETLVRFCCQKFVRVRDLIFPNVNTKNESVSCVNCINCDVCSKRTTNQFRMMSLGRFPNYCEYCKRHCCTNCVVEFSAITDCSRRYKCGSCSLKMHPPKKCCVCEKTSSEVHHNCDICSQSMCCGLECLGRCQGRNRKKLCSNEGNRICRNCFTTYLGFQCCICKTAGCKQCCVQCSHCFEMCCEKCCGECSWNERGCPALTTSNKCYACYPKCEICKSENCCGCRKCRKCNRTFCFIDPYDCRSQAFKACFKTFKFDYQLQAPKYVTEQEHGSEFGGCLGFCRSCKLNDLDDTHENVSICWECHPKCQLCNRNTCYECSKKCSNCQRVVCTERCLGKNKDFCTACEKILQS